MYIDVDRDRCTIIYDGKVSYIKIDNIPVNTSGKIDKNKLPNPKEYISRQKAETYINEGRTLKRRKAASHSRVAKNYHRTSHIYVCVTDNMQKKED